MPPPKAILCPICGGKYFKASLPIHMKKCKEMYDATHSQCEYCGMMVGNHDWQDHRTFCKPSKSMKKSKHELDAILSLPITNDAEFLPADIAGKMKHDPASDTTDPRIQCKFCGRKFNPDRIHKHMRICNKISKHSNKRKVWDGAKKRIEGTDFAKWEKCRSKTPELVKEWKSRGRRWRDEREQFKTIIGSKETDDSNFRAQIKSLSAPAIEVAQVGINKPATCNAAMLTKVPKKEVDLTCPPIPPSAPEKLKVRKASKAAGRSDGSRLKHPLVEKMNRLSTEDHVKRRPKSDLTAHKLYTTGKKASQRARGTDLGKGSTKIQLQGKPRNMVDYRAREAERRRLLKQKRGKRR